MDPRIRGVDGVAYADKVARVLRFEKLPELPPPPPGMEALVLNHNSADFDPKHLEFSYRACGFSVSKSSAVEKFPPPDRSELLKAFEKKLNASGLSCGARALSKHAHRDLEFWGALMGSVFERNRAALTTIESLMQNATFMNLHTFDHGALIFEVRVSDGHGARWEVSSNETTFRGFVEPVNEDTGSYFET